MRQGFETPCPHKEYDCVTVSVSISVSVSVSQTATRGVDTFHGGLLPDCRCMYIIAIHTQYPMYTRLSMTIYTL